MSVYKNENGTLKPIASNNKIVDQPLEGLVTKEEFDAEMKSKLDVITDTGRPVKATVIFSFDQAAIDARVTILEEYGFRGVFSDSGSVSNELMRELADRGFDYSIYGGTGTRPGLDGSVDAWYEYIAGSVDKLTSVGLRYPTLYSCPSHTASLNMIEACKKLGFKYVRCASISNNTTTVNSGWIYPRNNTFNPFKIAICPTNINKGWDIVKSALDEAIENNYMVMLFAHKPNYDGYTEEYYRQVVEYVHTKVSEGVLDCLTPREYYDRYRHENDFKQMSIKVDDMPDTKVLNEIMGDGDYVEKTFEIVSGKYISAGGTEQEMDTYMHSVPIAVNTGEKIQFFGKGNPNAIAMIASCDKDGNHIKVRVKSSVENARREYTYTVPIGVYYIIVSASTTAAYNLYISSANRFQEVEIAIDKNIRRVADIGLSHLFRKVVCIGDSFTEGYVGDGTHAENKPDFSWVANMSKITGNEWVNLGTSGTNARTWITTTNNKMVEEGKAQAYVIGLGINDCASGTDRYLPVGTIDDIGTETDSYFRWMAQIIENIISISPDAIIFVNTCPNVVIATAIAPYNDAVRSIVEHYKNTYNIHCIDLADTYSDLFTDETFTRNFRNDHPTIIGHAQMAKMYEYALNDYMVKNYVAFEGIPWIAVE